MAKLEQFIENVDSHLFLNRFDNLLSDQQRLQILLKTKQFHKIGQLLDSEQTHNKLKEAQLKYQQVIEKKLKQVQQLLDFLKKNNEFLEKNGFSLAAYQKLNYSKKMTDTMLINLQLYSILLMDQGQYQESLRILQTVKSIFMEQESINIINKIDFLFGKIQLQLILNIDSNQELCQLKELLVQVQQQNMQMIQFKIGFIHKLKTNFLHLVLLNAFNDKTEEKNYNILINSFNDECFSGIVQLECQYLQTFLLVAIIHQYQKEQMSIQQYLELLNQRILTVDNSLVTFVKLLFDNYDYPKANQCINNIETEFSEDPLTKTTVKQLVQQLKEILFDTYCKIYSCLDLNLVSEFLALSLDDSEIWMIEFIRKYQIDSKIDSESNLIRISQKQPKFMEQIKQKIEPIMNRTTQLVSNIKIHQKKQQ